MRRHGLRNLLTSGSRLRMEVRSQHLDYQSLYGGLRSRDRYEAPESRQNLVICGIIWNLVGLGNVRYMI